VAKWPNDHTPTATLGYSIDVALADAIQCAHLCNAIVQQYGLGPRVPMDAQMANRYLVVVEGNTFVGRLASQLGTKARGAPFFFFFSSFAHLFFSRAWFFFTHRRL
jgi:hypothetical protein